MIKSRNEHIQVFVDAIKLSLFKNEFRWDIFFNQWFRVSGQPNFFLFKKNLGVTNTQFFELFSLVNNHVKLSYTEDSEPHILFHATNHIRLTFQNAINSLLENYDQTNDDIIYSFCDRYLDVYTNTAAVDMFYGSCAIFLPPGLELDLERIVFESGYIHSAGPPLFVRNLNKARKPDFIDSLEEHLNSYEKSNKQAKKQKIPLVVYSHEDFSSFDSDHKDLIDKGIAQNKMYVEKMSMGRFRLSTILNEIKSDSTLNKRLKIAEPGSYRIHQNFNSDSTIWLITDKSVSSGSLKNPGQSRYYICYHQLIKSESPFFIFDENKPGWKSHTTLPHSLTAALINICKPLNKEGSVCDPFGGTGTTWLEAKRMGLLNKTRSSDLSPLTRLLHEDNLKFFLEDYESLSKIKLVIEKTTEKPILDRLFSNKTEGQLTLELMDEYNAIKSPLVAAVEHFNILKEEQPNEEYEYVFSNNLVSALSQLSFASRILFYLLLKTELRHKAAFKRNSLEFSGGYRNSAKDFLNQLNLFISSFKENVNTYSEHGHYHIIEGKYSKAAFPSFLNDDISQYSQNLKSEVLSNMDAKKLEPSSNSVIICDPPYGFNTNEEDQGLADLYSEFLDKAIESLQPYGQLIICVPAESYTGRDLPYCTYSDIISRQILLKAKAQGRLTYNPAISVPSRSFFAPYYWEADKALRRSILHFHFV